MSVVARILHGVGLYIIGGSVLMAGLACQEATPVSELSVEAVQAQPMEHQPPPTHAMVRRPGQDTAPTAADVAPKALDAMTKGFVAGGLRGNIKDVEAAVNDLILGVTTALNSKLPDPEAALVAVEAYITSAKDRTKKLGAQIVAMKLSKKQRSAVKRRASRRYEETLTAYQLAVARFELEATSGQLLRFNALMKGLAAPMRK